MNLQHEKIRWALAQEPLVAGKLMEKLGVSQPTLSRSLAALGSEIVRVPRGRSVAYALRDTMRGLAETPVYRVSSEGQLEHLGSLIPVRSDGFVMQQADGKMRYSEGLPWWLQDMRPQGFMGRAFAARYAPELGLPPNMLHWSDSHALRALVAYGGDAVGNLVLGDVARDQFINAARPLAIALEDKGRAYAELANAVSRNAEIGSSAGGEQPKFATYAQTAKGCQHVLVKFTQPDVNPITERWRDLLLTEHLAMETLRDAGVDAAQSAIIDHAGQRFLEVTRFDRVGELGRRALHSLSAVDAEFTGMAEAPWPEVTAALAAGGHITPAAHSGAALLYAFGTLIGNTDMHPGNLSFVSDHGQPYALAPAYDMLPMGFSPRSSGALTDTLAPAVLRSAVAPLTWVRALELARAYHARLSADTRFSSRFSACIEMLAAHLAQAQSKLERLAA